MSTTISLRSVEKNQLTEMLPIAIEAYTDLGEDNKSFAEKADTLADIQAEVSTTDGDIERPAEDWEVVVSALGHDNVITAEGENRVHHLRKKLAWRGIEDETQIKAVIPRN